MEEFLNLFKIRKDRFENFFHEVIFNEIRKKFHPLLAEACIYSLSAGGKRIRPVLVLSAYLSSENQSISNNVLFLSSAVECIHTYSLIHDDLPAMDNDDYRRGVLTCHKKFSESTAILAGDALNSFGFYLPAKMEIEDSNTFSDIQELLHSGAGGEGMVSGQIEDLQLENNPNFFSEDTLNSIHRKKTGALILSSLLIGNRLTKEWKEKEKNFQLYGEKVGLLFQITDDIIDEESSFEELGKTPGKDAANGKLTYPSLYGMEKAKRLRDDLKGELIAISESLESNKSHFFRDLPVYIAERKN
ncbi:MAG TPA: polyprenyl synthetase family protein [Leptospiraceae bacterium]|nr:polyprenyl synthetase family protein [Leptospiraceae bacterium]HMW06118.1 polyprenyl synthetase family protein [Leptospiraceae bacterium]HMX30754.1 polyprenyl synthetase family protein [Leptospiraceae bacterium]HMY31779.1 polyprenyl synthetase family protein [Leptospiraceae bacterium]HMZ63110.1 polyprenyl synthetase family protein [Leptospiraceae bacterium]